MKEQSTHLHVRKVKSIELLYHFFAFVLCFGTFSADGARTLFGSCLKRHTQNNGLKKVSLVPVYIVNPYKHFFSPLVPGTPYSRRLKET